MFRSAEKVGRLMSARIVRRLLVGGLVPWGSYSVLHRHTYGTIDRHLEPGREYFFKPTYDVRIFLQQYEKEPPVFAMDVEGDEEIYIDVLNEQQKVDHGVAYKRGTRALYGQRR